MPRIRSAGILMDLPDVPGVYFIVCAYMGDTGYGLGDVLYIGLSNSIRRRVAYSLATPGKSAPHSVQQALMEFQQTGGLAHLLFYTLESGHQLGEVESALLEEFRRRTGGLPPWNRTGPRRLQPPTPTRNLACQLLNHLGVRKKDR